MKLKTLKSKMIYDVVVNNKNFSDIMEDYRDQVDSVTSLAATVTFLLTTYGGSYDKEIHGLSKATIKDLIPYQKLYRTENPKYGRYNGSKFFIARSALEKEIDFRVAPKFIIYFEDGCEVLASINEIFDVNRLFKNNVINFDSFIYNQDMKGGK